MNDAALGLADLFPDGGHRFHLTLRRTEPAAFFSPQDPTGRLLAERAHWLNHAPGQYAAVRAEGEGLLREFAAMAAAWGFVTAPGAGTGPFTAQERMRDLGRRLEPDILFLSPDNAGQFRLRGGALCFPTGWALAEKIGETLDAIHGVVPGLNAALGSPIQQFLSRLKPGVAFLRDNWGLAATDELNLHPARGIAPPRNPVALDRLWLRVEHQAVVALPESGGIVFGIRLELRRLDQFAGTPAASALRHALEAMPPELARYKRLEDVLPQIAGLL